MLNMWWRPSSLNLQGVFPHHIFLHISELPVLTKFHVQHPSRAAEHILFPFVLTYWYGKSDPGHFEKWDFSQLTGEIILCAHIFDFFFFPLSFFAQYMLNIVFYS